MLASPVRATSPLAFTAAAAPAVTVPEACVLGRPITTLPAAYAAVQANAVYATYRSGLAPACLGGFDSDAGWGCTLRSLQMLAATAALRVLRLAGAAGAEADDTRRRIALQLVADVLVAPASQAAPMAAPPFSVYTLVAAAGAVPRWFGPREASFFAVAAASAKQARPAGDGATDEAGAADPASSPASVAASSGTHPGTPSSPDNVMVVALAADGCVCLPDVRRVAAGDGASAWRPTLLLVPARLGPGATVSPQFAPSLLHALSCAQSIGCVGGRPKHSLFIVGTTRDGRLLALDPHVTQSNAAIPLVVRPAAVPVQPPSVATAPSSGDSPAPASMVDTGDSTEEAGSLSMSWSTRLWWFAATGSLDSEGLVRHLAASRLATTPTPSVVSTTSMWPDNGAPLGSEEMPAAALPLHASAVSAAISAAYAASSIPRPSDVTSPAIPSLDSSCVLGFLISSDDDLAAFAAHFTGSGGPAVRGKSGDMAASYDGDAAAAAARGARVRSRSSGALVHPPLFSVSHEPRATPSAVILAACGSPTGAGAAGGPVRTYSADATWLDGDGGAGDTNGTVSGGKSGADGEWDDCGMAVRADGGGEAGSGATPAIDDASLHDSAPQPPHSPESPLPAGTNGGGGGGTLWSALTRIMFGQTAMTWAPRPPPPPPYAAEYYAGAAGAPPRGSQTPQPTPGSSHRRTLLEPDHGSAAADAGDSEMRRAVAFTERPASAPPGRTPDYECDHNGSHDRVRARAEGDPDTREGATGSEAAVAVVARPPRGPPSPLAAAAAAAQRQSLDDASFTTPTRRGHTALPGDGTGRSTAASPLTTIANAIASLVQYPSPPPPHPADSLTVSQPPPPRPPSPPPTAGATAGAVAAPATLPATAATSAPRPVRNHYRRSVPAPPASGDDGSGGGGGGTRTLSTSSATSMGQLLGDYDLCGTTPPQQQVAADLGGITLAVRRDDAGAPRPAPPSVNAVGAAADASGETSAAPASPHSTVSSESDYATVSAGGTPPLGPLLLSPSAGISAGGGSSSGSGGGALLGLGIALRSTQLVEAATEAVMSLLPRPAAPHDALLAAAPAPAPSSRSPSAAAMVAAADSVVRGSPQLLPRPAPGSALGQQRMGSPHGSLGLPPSASSPHGTTAAVPPPISHRRHRSRDMPTPPALAAGVGGGTATSTVPAGTMGRERGDSVYLEVLAPLPGSASPMVRPLGSATGSPLVPAPLGVPAARPGATTNGSNRSHGERVAASPAATSDSADSPLQLAAGTVAAAAAATAPASSAAALGAAEAQPGAGIRPAAAGLHLRSDHHDGGGCSESGEASLSSPWINIATPLYGAGTSPALTHHHDGDGIDMGRAATKESAASGGPRDASAIDARDGMADAGSISTASAATAAPAPAAAVRATSVRSASPVGPAKATVTALSPPVPASRSMSEGGGAAASRGGGVILAAIAGGIPRSHSATLAATAWSDAASGRATPLSTGSGAAAV